ncbi:retrovirus-related pol polyprotein from transposon TNT 1-94 [Tanacetum coccineum]
MNPQETQVVARDEKWVPSVERVKISSTNIILETTVPQKEETFQVVIDIIKNSTCFKAFTISADVSEIFMQQFWYTIKKVQDTDSYEFLLANKKCTINAEVFRTILDICPRVEGVDFIDVPDNDTTLTFLIDLGYKGPLNRIMNPQETQQVAARNEKWVPSTERVKISFTNIRLETTVPQKEETFQVIIDVIKNSTCFKAFTISANVPEIFMHPFWYTIKKVQDTDSYEFLLANKKCIVNAEVFRTILNICPRVEGEDVTDVPDDETALTFLLDLGYKGPLNRHTSMENVDYPALIWEDIAYQIDHRKEKRSRRENMPYPRFTKIIINHFLKQHKSLTNLNHKHYHTIKDDGIVSRLKFVRIGEDYQEYRLPILDVMLNDAIKRSESYHMFIKYSTNQIPPKKSRANKLISPSYKLSQTPPKSISQTEAEEAEAARKVHATHKRIVTESVPESAKKKSGGRSSKSVVIQDTPSTLKSKPAISKTKLKGAPSLTPQEQEAAYIMQALKESKNPSSDTQDADDEDVETESDKDDIYKYKIRVHKDEDVEMKDAKVERSDKGDEERLLMQQRKKLKRLQKQRMIPRNLNSLHLAQAYLFLQRQPISTTVHSPQVTPIFSSVQQTPTPIPTPPIITDALTATTAVPESNVLTTVELRVIKLEKDVSELKTIDLSSKALAVLQSQVPILTKKPTPTSEQESEKSPLDILKIKREQVEKQKMTHFTIKSTDKAALEEHDLKSTLYQSMNANKSFNRNPANHRLYHALMEHVDDKDDDDEDDDDEDDDDEDDDDEDPPAKLNQGKKTKRRRTKESKSSKKLSTTKETPKGKAPTKGSKTGKSDSAKELVEEPIAEVVMDDAGDDVARDVNQPQDTSEPKTRKTLNPEWFKQPPRPPTHDPEWNKRQVVLD